MDAGHFISLDGCHIKHRFGGQILSVVVKDANDNIFPVVMAVVEQERSLGYGFWKFLLMI